MFTAVVNEVVGFDAESLKEKSTKVNSTQTENFKNCEKGCQVLDRTNVQVQTDSLKKNCDIFADYDIENLTNFLHRVESYVCFILDRNINSKAFNHYELLSNIELSTITCLYVLERSLESELNCCNVSWNCTGTSIAAAYINNIHEDWCDHDGSIAIWNVNRRNFDPKKPNTVLETNCCITCIAFHPEIPSILVAGKFSGEIVLYNISKDDDSLLGSSKATLNNHREPITGLFWLLESKSHDSMQFLSCSLDGKILIWKLENNELFLIDGFIVLSEHLPHSFQIKSTRENSEVGILSLSINHEDRSIFIMGTEGGGILQGSFSSLSPASYSGLSSVALKNPISMCFDRHKGQVTTVEFSTFSRNIFLSSGSDGEVRIYTLLQTKPVLILISPNTGISFAAWSLVRPMVLSSICSDGQIHIWDLMINSKQPTRSIRIDSKYSAGMSLQYNFNSQSLMATSSSDGKIQIWQLPGYLLQQHSDELQQLQNLSKNII